VKEGRHWAVSQTISFSLLVLLCVLVVVPVAIAHGIGQAVSFVLFFLPDAWTDAIRYLVLKVLTVPFTILGLAVVYAALPRRRMALEEVLPAAVFAGVAFEVGKYVYIALLPLMEFQRMYGGFYVTITLVVWALFSAMILILGAYLTAQDLLPRPRRGAPAG
jgi:membrane protein/epoxyqueuosine reductase